MDSEKIEKNGMWITLWKLCEKPSVRFPQVPCRSTFSVLGWEQIGRLRGTGVEKKFFVFCFSLVYVQHYGLFQG